MRYRGLINWPPIWTRRGDQANKRAVGEVGVLRDVFLSRVEPRSRVYLVIEHEGEEYMGCLLFTDAAFCDQVYSLLTGCYGYPIADIGSLEVAHLL